MNGTLLPVLIGTIRSLKDKSISITIETQEISPGKAGELFALRDKLCYVYFSGRQIEIPDIKMIDKLEPELQGKSPSLRLRNVLYRCWENNNEGYTDDKAYYQAKMEQIISTYKSNLNP